MNLERINEALEIVASALREKAIAFERAEYNYERRFSDLMVHSGMGTIPKQEAEARLTLDSEGLWEPLVELRGELRALYHEKDCLISIASNLRSMNRKEMYETGGSELERE